MALHEIKNCGFGNFVAPNVSISNMKPLLIVEAPKANDAIAFYKAAFGAHEVGRTMQPKRMADQEIPLILAAELEIGGFTIYVSDFIHDSDNASKTGGNNVVMMLEIKDVSAAIAKAVSAGVVVEREIVKEEGASWRGCMGWVKDPYGFVWTIVSL